jgi:hypothetical protein
MVTARECMRHCARNFGLYIAASAVLVILWLVFRHY